MGSREPIENRLAGIVDQLHEGLQVVDRDMRYVYLNDAAVAHARRAREELIGKTMAEAYPGIDETPMYATLRRCLETGERASLVNEFDYPDGQRRTFELRFQPIDDGGVVILSSDVTERAMLQAQLRQAQKMEAIGRLAGGVAHDFNNLLSVIDVFTRIALESLPDTAPAREDLGEVLRASERAAELTGKLLTFSRHRGARQVQSTDLNAVVSDMERMIARLVRADVRTTVRLAEGLWKVEVDAAAIEQVLLNLVVNAHDAMPGGGQLVIETTNVVLDDELRMRFGRVVAPGEYVVLAVSDTGTGMSADVQERAFDPFFTTKPPGEGTGLGLSVCFGIVDQAGGYIGVYSELGQGTVFRVYLPRGAGEQEDRPRRAPMEARGGSERIAVVEDDEQVRAAMVRTLERLGYAVVEITGPDAVAEVSSVEGLDLLVTDVMMPHTSGPALAKEARLRHAGLRVLYVSGYAIGAAAQRSLIEAGAPLLEKPFTPSALARAVRAALDA